VTKPSPERDFLKTLRGAHSMEDLYRLAAEAGILDRDGGDVVIHGKTDTVGKRRLRGAIQTMRRQEAARALGQTRWFLEGTPERPRRVIFVSLAGSHREVELRLEQAVDLLAQLDGEADIVLTDPPWALGIGTGARTDTCHRAYERGEARNDLVVPGYQDVAPEDYPEFTREWVCYAANAIRPGGYLAVVTGPQQAARVQVAAEDEGLTFVNQIIAEKYFAMRTTSRHAQAHWTITVMCRGPLQSRLRYFNPPDDMVGRSGGLYPRDVWPARLVGRADARPGAVRYPTTLPAPMIDRVLDAYVAAPTADEAPLLVEPFNGGGTITVRAALRGLRVLASDVNPGSLAFTSNRLAEALTGAHS
jgi:hypothetical protein